MSSIADAESTPAVTVDCSILVPVLDEERHIETTLAAMRSQRFDGRLEFIFADGGSTDRTPELLRTAGREDPRIVVIENPRHTVTSGLNVALAHARGRWVARMDAHTTYRDDYVARGISRLLEGDTRWVSGPPLPVGHGRVSRAVAAALGTETGRSGSRKWAAVEDADAAEYELDSGVFGGVWERVTLLAYGGWDEAWTVNEDSELAARFLENGEPLICVPAMVARYSPRDSLTGLWRQYRRYGRFRIKTAVRHPGTLRHQHLVAPALVADAALAIGFPRALRWPARMGLGLYAATLIRCVPSARRDGLLPWDEALLVPVTLATMHLAWGTGTWQGMISFGFPGRAIIAAMRDRAPARPKRSD